MNKMLVAQSDGSIFHYRFVQPIFLKGGSTIWADSTNRQNTGYKRS